ncbi:MAG: hypothetical protein Q9207_001882 [Kuettlingeria erythrocarpa]
MERKREPTLSFDATRSTSAAMQITISITAPQGAVDHDLLTVDVGPEMTIADLKAVIESDSRIPSHSQVLYHNGNELQNDSVQLGQANIKQDDMLGLLVRNRRPQQRSNPSQPGDASQLNSRGQMALGNPVILNQIRSQNGDLADAVNDSSRFSQIYEQMLRQRDENEAQKQRELALLNADPFNVEAQAKIEEMIRQERVLENLQHAMDHTPEVFGRVHMLYIDVEVNGHKVKAFVDSGAQATIMSPACAERCGIMRLIDRRYGGQAVGVGTAKILGRVHSAQIKIGNLFFPCNFSVMEQKDVEILLGLDMLKRHQACIDLRKGKLVIQDLEVPFLGEADIPKMRETLSDEETVEGPAGMKISAISGAVEPPAASQASPKQQSSQSKPQPMGQSTATATESRYPAADIAKLMELGVSREEAINSLERSIYLPSIIMKTTWKEIQPVPTSQEFLDIVLSRTQRRLPTQIRSGFKISRIRAFYTRKVKYTQETFTEKLSAILEGFPRLQDIHPFHKDLLNTLYDADHFRIALGNLATTKHLIETVSRDYVRLLKYAQSLFQCKQLKRAALGRMATLCRRLKDPLVYLEQVRQHLGRLPSIDPNTRTLLICGYPNVGKSSFLRSVTRADVDVQPYAFTTKSLFVGHFDYKYLRFQAIDTPGILDHPLEEMNTIEMQSITAIAHLRSAILYFMDLSEQCGYSVQAQIQLFQSIKPLFANKLVFIVINKIDITRPEDLDTETKEKLDSLLRPGDVELLQLSCTTTEGVMEVKNAACERLIAERVAQKLKSGTNSSGTIGGRLGDVLTRIHVAQPLGGVLREPYIPDAVKRLKKYSKDDPERRKLARDMEEENGGAGVYNVDLKEQYLLDSEEWKHDRVPEVFDGKNVYDFIDPDIEAKLEALEEEEEKLEGQGYYDSDESVEDAEDANIRMQAELIKQKRDLIRNEAKMKKSLKNRPIIPRPARAKKLSVMEDQLDKLGFDTTSIAARARSQSRGRSAIRSRAETDDAMDLDRPQSTVDALRAKSRLRSQSNRREDGVTTLTARSKADRLAKLGQKKMNRMARQGEADRHTTSALPKHLFAIPMTCDGIAVNERTESVFIYYEYPKHSAMSLHPALRNAGEDIDVNVQTIVVGVGVRVGESRPILLR